MAGIWERIKKDSSDRLNVHLFESAFILYTTGDFTVPQIIAGLNADLDSPLSGQELTDMNNIAAQLDGIAQTTNKLVYINKIRAITIVAETGGINETKFRSVLGIV